MHQFFLYASQSPEHMVEILYPERTQNQDHEMMAMVRDEVQPRNEVPLRPVLSVLTQLLSRLIS
jgi:hypothetical protein